MLPWEHTFIVSKTPMGTGVNGFGVSEHKESNKQEQFTKGKNTQNSVWGRSNRGK